MLLAGIDVSGRPESGNYMYMSIIIGTKEKIESIIKHLGNEDTHMHMVHDRGKHREIISKLSFDSKECIAFCYHIELDATVKEIRSIKRSKAGMIGKKRVFVTCYYALWRMIQEQIKAFLQKHRCDIHDVVFQCDSDSDEFLKIAGLKRSYKDNAHTLSDIVAWANNKKMEPDGVISTNLATEIKKHAESEIK